MSDLNAEDRQRFLEGVAFNYKLKREYEAREVAREPDPALKAIRALFPLARSAPQPECSTCHGTGCLQPVNKVHGPRACSCLYFGTAA